MMTGITATISSETVRDQELSQLGRHSGRHHGTRSVILRVSVLSGALAAAAVVIALATGGLFTGSGSYLVMVTMSAVDLPCLASMIVGQNWRYSPRMTHDHGRAIEGGPQT